MLLLFFHLLQDGVLLDLDQIAPLVLSQSEPELFDPFTLLGRARAPDLAVILRGLGGAGAGGRPGFVRDRCVRRWGRWMMVCMIMWIRMGRYRSL